MNSLIEDYRRELLAVHEPPCLSLYQPTHRHGPENQQDPLRFRNLLKAMNQSLQQKYPKREIQSLMEPFEALAHDHAFWAKTLDGLAVLAAAGIFRTYTLQRTVPELVVVADSFHTKPLIRIIQSADRYQVLGLNRGEVKLFEGNRDALDEIELAPGVPKTLTDALGSELTEPHQTVASYGKGAAGPVMHHGHGSRKDELEIDTERFFRAVDRAVLEHHSKPSGLPLILAALPEYHSLFRQVSHNPFLLADAVDVHPDAVSMDEFRSAVWRAVEPHYLERLSKLVEQFEEANSKALGTDCLDDVAAAAVEGRIATLLIEADRRIPGRVATATGRIHLGDPANPELDDLLDDLGELVIKMGGEVIVVPSGRMPSRTGLAAIFRY